MGCDTMPVLMHPIESLHNHTTLSDGKLSHRELFDIAESLGISVLAFTDHDAVPPSAILAELETLRGRDTKWIIGIELTTDLPRELAPNSAAVHIIGLFIDPQNKALLEHCERAQKSRIKRMRQIVEGLQGLGFIITAEDCLAVSWGESVGRPHIVEALKKHTENNVVIEKLRLEMRGAAEHDPVIKEKYDHMMRKGEQQYPYVLFLSDDSFRSAYFDHDYMPDLDLGVSIIREAGGVAILAHYFTVKQKMSLEALERVVSEERLDGVEVVYGLREYGTTGEAEMSKERQALREMTKKYGVLALGGSDAHTVDDLERFIMNDWFSGETVGFTKKILDTGRVSKKFSSLE